MNKIESTKEEMSSNSYSGDPILSVEGFVSKEAIDFQEKTQNEGKQNEPGV